MSGFEVNATVKLVEGMKFSSVSDSGHEVIMDAPAEHGGMDAGARPMELVLMGLGGCTSMDAMSILRKKKQDVSGLEVKLSGTRAAEHPMRYENITLEFIVTGKGVDEKAAKRAIELSMEKYCSVKFTLEQETKIEYKYTVQEG